MPDHHAQLAASILDADMARLGEEVTRAVEAGADRIHLDVMDGHFVPNITFGPDVIRHLRPLTDLPFDAHLMIAEPSRYVGAFLDAGCDTITFHVEVNETIEPTLQAIRAARRGAGLAVSPATPVAALEPYRPLLDQVIVMTVVPGLGGQAFLPEPAHKIQAAHSLLGDRPGGGYVHVDGGVNRDTAEFVGGLGVDILVVGSTLWKKGNDIAGEIRLIKNLADEGYARELGDGTLRETAR